MTYILIIQIEYLSYGIQNNLRYQQCHKHKELCNYIKIYAGDKRWTIKLFFDQSSYLIVY